MISTVQAGVAKLEKINNMIAHQRKRSNTQDSQFHQAVHLYGTSGSIRPKWTDVCGVVKPPNSHTEWLIQKRRECGHGRLPRVGERVSSFGCWCLRSKNLSLVVLVRCGAFFGWCPPRSDIPAQWDGKEAGSNKLIPPTLKPTRSPSEWWHE